MAAIEFWSAGPCHRFGPWPGAWQRIGFRRQSEGPELKAAVVASPSNQSGDKAPHSKMADAGNLRTKTLVSDNQ